MPTAAPTPLAELSPRAPISRARLQARVCGIWCGRTRGCAIAPDNPATDESWENIEPLLNQGLDNLVEKDRTAILLRFFRGLSMAEVAESLGTTEPAAKMRVGRAVEKLRTFFSQHGIACSAAALLVLLEENASAQPPTSVLSSVLNELARSEKGSQAAPHVSTAGLRWQLGLSLGVGMALLGLIVAGSGKLWRNQKSIETRSTEVAGPVPTSRCSRLRRIEIRRFGGPGNCRAAGSMALNGVAR